MRGEERIRHYLDRAFYGARQTKEIHEEKEALLAELTEKYQALITQGYEPEAAYQSVISGIGDIFELVDGIAGEPVEQDSRPPERTDYHFNPMLTEAAPYAAAGILFLFWIITRLLPAGPKDQSALPLLILGAAAGAGILWMFFTYPKPFTGSKIPPVHLAVAVLWCITAVLFFLAATKPHLRSILWLIPIGALAVTQLIFSWTSYKDLKKRGDLDE